MSLRSIVKPADQDFGPLKLRLPATSANLGPGFDAAAVALDFYLEIEAAAAEEFSILASGYDAERCGRLEDNLILEIYKGLLARHERALVPLKIRMMNEIPLGMGCGSSEAGSDCAGEPLWTAGMELCADSGRGLRAGGPSGQRGGLLAGRVCCRGQ